MAKQHPRDFSFSQRFFIVTPAIAAIIVVWFERQELEFPQPLYFVAAGLGVSLMLLFLMVYGEDL